eukprot:IDg14476t1
MKNLNPELRSNVQNSPRCAAQNACYRASVANFADALGFRVRLTVRPEAHHAESGILLLEHNLTPCRCLSETFHVKDLARCDGLARSRETE